MLCIAIVSSTLCGTAAQAGVENPAKCYRLNDFDYMHRRLEGAMTARQDLVVTIAVVDDDVARRSGTPEEWGTAATEAMTLWSDALRKEVAPLGITVPAVRFKVGDMATYPNYDVQLIVHAEGVFTAPGVPAPTNGNGKNKFDAYVTPDWTGHRPIINVFPSSQGWKGTADVKAKVRRTLLKHEAGHAWQLRDIYDSSQLEGNRRTVLGYEDCTGNLMYKYRETLGSGDVAGIKAAFLATLQSLYSFAQTSGYPGTPSGAYEDGRWWIDEDDPALIGVTVAPAAGYILDGYGGISPFGGAPALNTAGAPYWAGWDIARALTVLPDASGGWILDGWGGIHNFGAAPRIVQPAYWPNWDIARDLVVLAHPAGGYMGYVLDGWGGVHPFGGAPAFPQQNQRLQPGQYSGAMAYHAGQDTAQGLFILHDTGETMPSGGLVLERNGVMTRFGKYGVPGDYHDLDPRFPVLNRGLAWKKFAIVANGGFYAVGPADASRAFQSMTLAPIGAPDPLAVPNYWGRWDILRDVVPFKPGCVPKVSPSCLQ